MKINKIVYYGQGNGRDHINHICSINNSENIEVYSIIQNENALMEQEKNVIRVKNIEEALKETKRINPDLVVIGNRADLSSGATESFKNVGFATLGITKDVALLETSKEYSKEFMIRNNIPTPKYFVANNIDDAIDYVTKNWNKTANGLVFKVDQFSKNSFERTAVPEDLDDAINNIHRLFSSTPNARVFIEEKIKGYEISLHVLIKGNNYFVFPFVQDYKRKYPDNEGPMTAGTASVASTQQYPVELLAKIEKNIIIPTIQGFEKEKIKYDYILYIGLMITENDIPYVLEYNTRTGNPEWLAILGLLKGSLPNLLENYYNNFQNISSLWKENQISIAMYGFSAGYPETTRKEFEENIMGLDKVSKDIKVIGEHIKKRNNKYYPSGGRVFALMNTGDEFETVKNHIIDNFYKINMNGLYFRYDLKKIFN